MEILQFTMTLNFGTFLQGSKCMKLAWQSVKIVNKNYINYRKKIFRWILTIEGNEFSLRH